MRETERECRKINKNKIESVVSNSAFSKIGPKALLLIALLIKQKRLKVLLLIPLLVK